MRLGNRVTQFEVLERLNDGFFFVKFVSDDVYSITLRISKGCHFTSECHKAYLFVGVSRFELTDLCFDGRQDTLHP